MSVLQAMKRSFDKNIITELCELNWSKLTEDDMISVAWSYYFFSVQFRENLEIACEVFPNSTNLTKLKLEECATDNLSPFSGIAMPGEKMNHDEFMRRALCLWTIPGVVEQQFQAAGERYLTTVRGLTPLARALSIASYEEGGLENLFSSILTAPAYSNPALAAFRYFMAEHIRFDSDPLEGHGALSRDMVPDETVVPLWAAFKQLVLECVPGLAQASTKTRAIFVESDGAPAEELALSQ